MNVRRPIALTLVLAAAFIQLAVPIAFASAMGAHARGTWVPICSPHGVTTIELPGGGRDGEALGGALAHCSACPVCPPAFGLEARDTERFAFSGRPGKVSVAIVWPDRLRTPAIGTRPTPSGPRGPPLSSSR